MTTRTNLRFLFYFAAFVLLVSFSFAQERSRKMVGPFNLSGSAGAVFTDNRDSNTNEESNIDYFISPRLEAFFEQERLLLDLYYEPSYRYRDNPSDIQNDTELFHDFGVKARLRLTRQIQPWVRDTFMYTDDPEVTQEGAVLRSDASYLRNEVEAGMTYLFSERGNVDLSGRHMVKRYEEDIVARQSDETHVGGAFSAWRRITRTLGIVAGVRGTSYEYETIEAFDRGFDVVIGSIGFEKVFNPQLQGGVSAGYGQADYEESALGQQDFPYLNVHLVGQYAPFSKIDFWASHKIMESDVYPFSSQENSDVGMQVEFDTPKSIIARLSTRYALGRYERDFLPPDAESRAVTVKGDETVVAVSGTLGYRLRHDMSLRFRQTYEDIDSDVDISYTKNTSRIVLTKHF